MRRERTAHLGIVMLVIATPFSRVTICHSSMSLTQSHDNITHISLQTLLKAEKIDMLRKLKMAQDIAAGMDYLHTRKECKIVHRDLACRNCLVDDAYVVKGTSETKSKRRQKEKKTEREKEEERREKEGAEKEEGGRGRQKIKPPKRKPSLPPLSCISLSMSHINPFFAFFSLQLEIWASLGFWSMRKMTTSMFPPTTPCH